MIMLLFSSSSSARGQLNIQKFWGEGLLLAWFSHTCMTLVWQDRTFNRFTYEKQYAGDGEDACSCTISCA